MRQAQHPVLRQAHLVDQQAACVLDPGDAAAGGQGHRADGRGGAAGQPQCEFAQAGDEPRRHRRRRTVQQRIDHRLGVLPRQRTGLGGCTAPGRQAGKFGVGIAGCGQFADPRRVAFAVEQCRRRGRTRCLGAGAVFVAQPADPARGGGAAGIGPAVQVGQRAQAEPVVGRHAEGRDRDVVGGVAGMRPGRRRHLKGERRARGGDRFVGGALADPARSVEQQAPGVFAHHLGVHRCGAAREHLGAQRFAGSGGAGQLAGRRLRMAADREQPRHRGHGLGAKCGPATAPVPRRGASR